MIRYTYDGWDVIRENSSLNGITTYQNGLGIDDKLRSKNRRTVRYFLTDHLGSTEALANASGAIVSSTSYDSFGNATPNVGSAASSTGSATSNIATHYRYTGREYDADTGLYYYRNRWYDPELGRFISEDPIGFASGDANLYGYVWNSPLSFTDPSGNYACGPQKDQKKKTCGLNPVTGKPGILKDEPSPDYPLKDGRDGREGKFGNIRHGQGGSGGFRERGKGGLEKKGKHYAIDITAPVGTPIYASMAGVVKRSNKVKPVKSMSKSKKQNSGFGGLVVINYDNIGLNGAYAHLSDVYVKVGEEVKAGQLIGLAGRTGNANNSGQPPGDDHLHYGRFPGEYKGGLLGGTKWIDPQKSLNEPCPE